MPARTTAKTDPAQPESSEAETPNAADAAMAEVLDAEIKFSWRGADFVVLRDTIQSARFLMAFASNEVHTLLFELLGPADAARFVALCERNESMEKVASEFLKEFGDAAGLGNS